MIDNTSAVDKSIVGELNFGAKTAKRVGWEQFEFTVEAPHLVRVTNAAYGFEKDDHSYLVGIEDRDGLLVPAECECKADQYNEEYDCKHKVCLATIGGQVVLEAAVNFQAANSEKGQPTTSKGSDEVRADGGTATKEVSRESTAVDAVKRDKCACPDLPDDFPCADCYITKEQKLPE